MADPLTTLAVKVPTRERVKQHAKYGESHDGVVRRLLDFYEAHNGTPTSA